MADRTVLEILPGETRTFRIDYSLDLPEGVGIDSATVAASNHYSGEDATNAVLGATDATVENGVVSFVCLNVALGTRYDVLLTLTLDDATPSVIPETFLLIGVRNRSL